MWYNIHRSKKIKPMKISRLLKKGRRWFFSLALFVLVFALACAVKIQAAGNVTGWLWGGTEDGLGNNTGVGWISVNNTSGGGATNYGVNVPPSRVPRCLGFRPDRRNRHQQCHKSRWPAVGEIQLCNLLQNNHWCRPSSTAPCR